MSRAYLNSVRRPRITLRTVARDTESALTISLIEETLFEIGAPYLADLVHAKHPHPSFPADQAQRKNAHTQVRRGRYWTRKQPFRALQGVIIASDFADRIEPGKQPAPRLRDLPPVAQQFQQLRREHDEAILLPLALLDAQQHALAVDIGDLQRDDLGYTQARAIGHAERRSVFDARGGREKSSHLLRAQNDWNPARLAHQRQTPDQIVAFERHLEKEPQRDDRCVDDSRAHMGLRHVLLKQTKVFGGCGIGRAAEKSREALDVTDVVGLDLLREMTRRHVFDHALAQRTDGLVGHGDNSCLA